MTRFIILIGFISTALLSCHSGEHEKKEESRFAVTHPVRKDTTFYNDYVCQIQSIQHVELRALEKGYLEKIFVDEGQYVRKGQVMFRILPIVYEAELQKAQAEVSFAEIEFLNTKRLADSNIVSTTELSLARAKFDKAKAELALAKTRLDFTTIRAPFDGIMDRLHVRSGSLVEEGELLTTVSDNSKMWVYYNVPETEYLDYITTEQSKRPTFVRLQMANQKLFRHDGKLETIEADFNNETGNIAFRATFPNPDKVLRHGETGNVLMPIVLHNALLIPQKATFEILDKKFVFVVSKEGVVTAREIKVGVEMPHLYEIADGLKDTDMILVDGLRKVKNNDKIAFELQPQNRVIAELNNLHAE